MISEKIIVKYRENRENNRDNNLLQIDITEVKFEIYPQATISDNADIGE